MTINIQRYIGKAPEELNNRLIQLAWNIDSIKFLLTHHLLKDKVNINTTNELGQTPLMLACRYNKMEVVKYLLESDDLEEKANVNKYDNKGKNALVYACQENFFHMAKYLIIEHDIEISPFVRSWLNGENESNIHYREVLNVINKMDLMKTLDNNLYKNKEMNKIIKI